MHSRASQVNRLNRADLRHPQPAAYTDAAMRIFAQHIGLTDAAMRIFAQHIGLEERTP